MELNGKWALITGASSGLGVDFARELAAQGMDLALVARREERLQEVASELSTRYGVRVLPVPLDLGTPTAFCPAPTYAAYGAAKAFVLNYSEALSFELKGTGVTSTALCPGITATEFLQVSGQKPSLYQRLVMMQSPAVARIGIRAMLAGRRSVVPGVVNTLTAWSTRLMPRRTSTWVTSLLMKL